MWRVLALSFLLLFGSELTVRVKVASSVGSPVPPTSGTIGILPPLAGAVGVAGPAIMPRTIPASSGFTCTPADSRHSAWRNQFTSDDAVELCTTTVVPA